MPARTGLPVRVDDDMLRELRYISWAGFALPAGAVATVAAQQRLVAAGAAGIER